MGVECEEISEYMITEDTNILQAMERIEKTSRKTLFVHCDGRLLAALTDGDVRRWILKGGNLNESVKQVGNYQPVYLDKNESHLAPKIMKETGLEAIPLVDKRRVIQKIIFLNDLSKEVGQFEQNLPVVMMAGGIGSRLLPYTQILPKPLIPIGELTIAEHIINQFRKYGCDDFRMIVNYKKNMIKAYFNELDKDYKLTYVLEDKPLGTGGGLSLLKGAIDRTFILTNCDILIDDDLTKAYRHHKDSTNVITMICSLKNFTIPYGVVDIGQDGHIESMQEKPDMIFYVNTGCYFVEPEVIERLECNKSVNFPDIVSRYMAEGKKVGIYPIGENEWLDMGQMDELEKMKERLGY